MGDCNGLLNRRTGVNRYGFLRRAADVKSLLDGVRGGGLGGVGDALAGMKRISKVCSTWRPLGGHGWRSGVRRRPDDVPGHA